MPQKKDTFVMDFMNDTESIQNSFEPYDRTTVLSKTTDPNKLHDLKADLDGHQVYSHADVEMIVERFLSGASRETPDEDAQVSFKGKEKMFVRTYNFLAGVLEFANPTCEKLSIFLNFLIPKFPAPVEKDLSKDVLETIEMDS